MEIADSIMGLIGNTPMTRLNRITHGMASEIFVKLEYLNPSGSIKDRIALYMIEAAEREGILHPGSTIVEASTGNTAIALSFVAAMKGYRMKVFTPRLVSANEKLKMMQLYGADVETIDTDYLAKTSDKSAHGGMIELLPRRKCLELESDRPDVWWARQFSNPHNATAHRETTGREILGQTDHKIDAFVASVGTAGTLVGVGEALRARIPNVKIVAVEPAGFPLIAKGKSGIEVVEGIAGGLLLEAADMVDEVLVIKDADAIEMANRLAREEGLLCGISSGANVLACLTIAKKYPELRTIVTVLPDGRDRYFTTERYTT